MASPPKQQQTPLIPTSSDPALLATIANCSTLFSRFVKCSKRAMTGAKSSPEYQALMSASTAAASNPADAAKFKRRLHSRACVYCGTCDPRRVPGEQARLGTGSRACRDRGRQTRRRGAGWQDGAAKGHGRVCPKVSVCAQCVLGWRETGI
ncbi:hypothetical protein BCR44DRAFT_1423052 [Catenaria anguillulae PL171]|uniref:Uncharacterized protein n=1 Tax=Catenaria anguillulae PL171 TaxID=765915 RepID=A0A1Y2I5G3_9FUNG|nr:hypothetical protein BCR44DRAFT_1423052 [Catenaria anguillulae PL171]